MQVVSVPPDKEASGPARKACNDQDSIGTGCPRQG
jgi:hypothetical protein